MNTNLKE